MNSDMSKRTSDFSDPKRNYARRRATSVLPTPVGPRKKKQPTGRNGDFRPARLRRMARARAVMALSWLMTRLCSSCAWRRRCTSVSSARTKPSLLIFFDRGDADAGPAGNNFLDILARHDAGGSVIELVALA